MHFGLLLLFCGAFTLAASPEATFNTSAALYLSVPSVRALASVVITTIPGYIYLGKNISIDVHINLGGFLNLNVDYLTGTSVDLSKEITTLNVTNKREKKLTVGITGWTTTILIYYNVSALWGMIDLQGPMNITVTEAGALLDVTFHESQKGYLFTMDLGHTKFDYAELSILAGKGYWFLDYLINNLQFILPFAVHGAMSQGIAQASTALNKMLQNSQPENIIMPIFPHSGLILKPLYSLSMDPAKETLILKGASVQVVNLTTKQPYYNRPISSQPVFIETLGLQNQVFISDNLLNSVIRAAAVDFPDMIMFNTSDDSVRRLMDELPEIGQVYGEHLDYVIKYGATPDTQITANKSMAHLFGNISAIVYVKLDPQHVQPMVTFYSNVSIKMNVTISNYRMFVMIKDVTVHKTDYVIHDENLKFIESEEELTAALQATLIEESSCLNGRFLLPYDLKKIQTIGYAAKYLKDGSIRFDKLDGYVTIGFNAHEL